MTNGTEITYGAFTNNDLHFSPSTGGEQWLKIYLGKSVAVGSFLLKAGYDQAEWQTGWYISVSNNGKNFKVLYTSTSDQGATEQTYYISSSDIKAYSY
jgi:hypothetical protein